MTDLGALFIGLGIWLGLWFCGSSLSEGLDQAAYRLQQAVEYVVDNWGVLEQEHEDESK